METFLIDETRKNAFQLQKSTLTVCVESIRIVAVSKQFYTDFATANIFLNKK